MHICVYFSCAFFFFAPTFKFAEKWTIIKFNVWHSNNDKKNNKFCVFKKNSVLVLHSQTLVFEKHLYPCMHIYMYIYIHIYIYLYICTHISELP